MKLCFISTFMARLTACHAEESMIAADRLKSVKGAVKIVPGNSASWPIMVQRRCFYIVHHRSRRITGQFHTLSSHGPAAKAAGVSENRPERVPCRNDDSVILLIADRRWKGEM